MGFMEELRQNELYKLLADISLAHWVITVSSGTVTGVGATMNGEPLYKVFLYSVLAGGGVMAILYYGHSLVDKWRHAKHTDKSTRNPKRLWLPVVASLFIVGFYFYTSHESNPTRQPETAKPSSQPPAPSLTPIPSSPGLNGPSTNLTDNARANNPKIKFGHNNHRNKADKNKIKGGGSIEFGDDSSDNEAKGNELNSPQTPAPENKPPERLRTPFNMGAYDGLIYKYQYNITIDDVSLSDFPPINCVLDNRDSPGILIQGHSNASDNNQLERYGIAFAKGSHNNVVKNVHFTYRTWSKMMDEWKQRLTKPAFLIDAYVYDLSDMEKRLGEYWTQFSDAAFRMASFEYAKDKLMQAHAADDAKFTAAIEYFKLNPPSGMPLCWY